MGEYSCSWSLQRQISVFKDMKSAEGPQCGCASYVFSCNRSCWAPLFHWETWSPLLKADTGSPDSSSMLLALSIHVGMAGLWMG